MNTNTTTYTCNVCGYTWRARPNSLEQGRKKPVACPQCLSRKWDQPPA